MGNYKKIAESPTLLINTISKELGSQGKKIYKFGFGQSPFLPPEEVITSLRENAMKKEYAHVQGDLELRELVSRFHKDAHGIQSNPAYSFVGPGSKILIFSILLAYKQTDVFIPAPSWVSYGPQVKLAGQNAILVPTTFENRWRITPESIREAAKSKKYKNSVIILNYPGNPDGLSYNKEEAHAIAEVARELDMLVISDEIYSLMKFDGEHYAFANAYPEKTITTTGLSKWCGAGGWRLGVALIPHHMEKDFIQSLRGIASETYSCASTPVLHAAKIAYKSYTDRIAYIQAQCSVLKEVADYCVSELRSVNVRLHEAQGAFYLFPDFENYRVQLEARDIQDAETLCLRVLQETGVALLPGKAFGMTSSELVARLAFVDFEDPLKQADFVLSRDCPQIIEGISRLCEWLKQV